MAEKKNSLTDEKDKALEEPKKLMDVVRADLAEKDRTLARKNNEEAESKVCW